MTAEPPRFVHGVSVSRINGERACIEFFVSAELEDPRRLVTEQLHHVEELIEVLHAWRNSVLRSIGRERT